MSIFSIMLQSGSILLREGLEAILIIAALVAFLRRLEAKEAIRAVYSGAVFALLASFALAFVFQHFYNGIHDDRVEIVMLTIATLLMLYMSGWLFLKQDWHRIQQENRQHIEQALSSGTMVSVAMIGFFAVLREGAETALFLNVAATRLEGWSFAFFLGLIAASVMLVVLFFIINWSTKRLPLKPFFMVTSAFLFIMAIKFVGAIVQELQEMQYLSFNDVPAWVAALLGDGWSIEVIIAQFLVAMVAIGGTYAVNKLKPQRYVKLATDKPSTVG